jgi:hypothetical protein
VIAVADARARLAALAGGDRDDVDDAGEGVGAVESGAGAAHDLDALDLIDVDRSVSQKVEPRMSL